MPREAGNRLLVHAAVEQRRHIQVPERVEMVLLGKAVTVIELPQVLGEALRVLFV